LGVKVEPDPLIHSFPRGTVSDGEVRKKDSTGIGVCEVPTQILGGYQQNSRDRQELAHRIRQRGHIATSRVNAEEAPGNPLRLMKHCNLMVCRR
jgi:hypothetical protein